MTPLHRSPTDKVGSQESRVRTARSLLVAAIGLAWLGSADPPIDTRNSAFWHRSLRNSPGLTDVCGDFTWLARATLPALAALGALHCLAAPTSIDRVLEYWCHRHRAGHSACVRHDTERHTLGATPLHHRLIEPAQGASKTRRCRQGGTLDSRHVRRGARYGHG